MKSALFPGSRAVWIAAGATALVLGVILLVALLLPRDVYLGSSSVGARNGIGILPQGSEMCALRQRVPQGTGTVRFDVDRVKPGSLAVRAKVTVDGRTYAGSAPWRIRQTEIQVPGLVDATADGPKLATVCVQSEGSDLGVWGQTMTQSDQLALRVDGEVNRNRLAIWYRPPGDEERPILLQLGDIVERASLWRPGVVGPWTYVAILFLLFPLLLYGSVRLIATADRRRTRSVALTVGLVTFAHAASWALITPPFQTPDEGEHYAYVQYFAETGKAVDPALVPEGRPTWASEQGIALEATRYASVIERDDTTVPWEPRAEGAWRTRTEKSKPDRDNGGGYHPATSSHSPAYYAALAPAYLATREASTFTKLTAMRLTSSVMAGLTALLAVLIALELMPGRRALAAVAGLLIGFLPTFAFMGGGVNNDMGVNLVAAALVFFVARSLHRGLTPATAVGIGVTLAAAPIVKGTAYALYPPVLLALLVLAWRHRSARGLVSLGAVAAGFAVIHFGWQAIADTFNRSVYTLPGGGSPVTSLGARNNIPAFMSWLWQIFVPVRPPFLTDFFTIKWPFFDIYVQRGFATFGWYAFYFPTWVYGVIVGAMAAVAALGVRAAWHFRHIVRRNWAMIVFFLLLPASVLTAIEAAYFTLNGIPHGGIAEQGRYAFTAITAIAVLIAAACFGLGRRRAATLGVVLVTGMAMFAYAGQWLTLTSYYL